MWRDMVLALIDPGPFFSSQVSAPGDKMRMTGPGVIVLLVALATLSATIALGDRLVALIPGDALFLFAMVYGFSSLGSFVGVLVTWPILSFALHAVSDVVNRRSRDIRKVLAVVGWGQVPMVLYGLILIGIAGLWPLSQQPAETIDQLQEVLSASRIGPVTEQLRWLFQLWSVGLIVMGLKQLYQTTWVKSLVSVAIPTLALYLAQLLILTVRG